MLQSATTQRIRELDIRINRDDVSRFVGLVEDTNHIHTDKKIAKSSGFSDTPIPGTMLHAYFEQLALGFGVVPSTYALKFNKKDTAYPEDMLKLIVRKQTDSELELECLNSEENVVASCESKLKAFSKGRTNGDPEVSYTFEISKERRDAFYSLIGSEFSERIPVSLVSAFIPAALLKFLSKQPGNHTGIYRRINLDLHKTPELGDLKVGLYFRNKRPLGEVFAYYIEGDCSQNGERILSANLRVTTSFDLKTL